jgi:thymidylate synthase ThyX
MAYLEQSTRYIAYDVRIGGRYRYHRDPDVLMSNLGTRYVGDMDRIFDTYADLLPRLQEHFREAHPKADTDSDFVYRQAIRAKAFDALRGILPAAALSNVGIYGTGQGYEALLLRMRSHPLPEAMTYADLMLIELSKVIPSFLKRVDLDDRGVAWSTYLETNRLGMQELTERLLPPAELEPDDAPTVRLVDFDPDAEVKLVASMLYPYTNLPEVQVEEQVRRMTVDERVTVFRTYGGDRANRRHKPGRALERPSYRFDILSDYGAFRDLQRHRMLTIEWQRLTPRHGFVRPDAVGLAGGQEAFDTAMARSADLHDALAERYPEQASYAVALAYRIRFVMHFNAREAMHMLELRSGPQGHPAYRDVAQRMHRLIADKAGHRVIAEMMQFVDHAPEPNLERLDAERRANARRRNSEASGGDS